jgi:hypothetical protein
MRELALAVSPFASIKPMYSRNAGWAKVTPMMELGYPKASCPNHATQKTIQKFFQFHCLSC